MKCIDKSKMITALSVVISVLMIASAWAQQIPDAGTLLREIERATGKQEMAPAPLTPIESPPHEAPLPEKAGQTVFVTLFKIQSTIFSEDELRAVLKDYVGRALTLSELQEATRKIGDYYTQHDYLAHAYLPPQTVRDGIVEIVVVESQLGQITIDPTSTTRLDHLFIMGLVRFRAGVGQWLRPSKLSEAMEVLNEFPGVRASSSLAPGRAESESAAVLKIEDGPLLNGSSLTLDKGGSQSTGAKRALLSTAIDDPFGQGEQFSLVGLKSSGSTYGRLGLTMPAGISGLVLGSNTSLLEYEVGGTLTPLNLHGRAWTVGLTANYPIQRSSGFSLTASATLDHKRMVDFGNNTTLGDKKIEVGTLGLSSMIRDDWMKGGTNHLGITISIGRVDLSKNQEKFKTDQSTAGTNGTFGKLSFSATRDQPLQEGITLTDNFRIQVARSNLDGSEQFSLGGQDGIRAYPSSEASGDSGWMNTLEIRWKTTDKLQLSGFYDFGRIQQHYRPWNGWEAVPGQPNDYLLHGVGIGMNWTPIPNLQIKATLAHTIGDNSGHDRNGNDSDGTQDQVRNWIQAIINY